MEKDKNYLISKSKSKVGIIFDSFILIPCIIVPSFLLLGNTLMMTTTNFIGSLFIIVIFTTLFLYTFLSNIFFVGELYLLKKRNCFLLKKLFSKKEIPVSEVVKIAIFPLTINLIFKNNEQIKFYDFDLFHHGGLDYGLMYRKERKEKFLKKLANFEVYLNKECL